MTVTFTFDEWDVLVIFRIFNEVDQISPTHFQCQVFSSENVTVLDFSQSEDRDPQTGTQSLRRRNIMRLDCRKTQLKNSYHVSHIHPSRETMKQNSVKLGRSSRNPMLCSALSVSQGIHWRLLPLDNVRSEAAL